MSGRALFASPDWPAIGDGLEDQQTFQVALRSLDAARRRALRRLVSDAEKIYDDFSTPGWRGLIGAARRFRAPWAYPSLQDGRAAVAQAHVSFRAHAINRYHWPEDDAALVAGDALIDEVVRLPAVEFVLWAAALVYDHRMDVAGAA